MITVTEDDLLFSKEMCLKLLYKIYKDNHCVMIKHGIEGHYKYTVINNKDIKKLIKYINKNYNKYLMKCKDLRYRIKSVVIVKNETYNEFNNIFDNNEIFIKSNTNS